jgi:hypothetical protein
MPLDKTDKKLINHIILLAILGLMAWFFPFGWGLNEQLKAQNEQREEVKRVVSEDLAKGYKGISPAVFMEPGSRLDGNLPPTAQAIKTRLVEYAEETKVKLAKLDKKQAESRMNFPDWAENFPPQRHPSVHLADTWNRHKLQLDTECRQNGVELMDPEIGFKELCEKGLTDKIDENKAKELLRQLHIAELVIRRCIEAKLNEESYEKAQGYKVEAFMRILRVRPEESEATGPWFRELNKQYDPNEVNPKSPKFRKYKRVWEGKPFIQEYPVEILLQCDLMTFQRFLYSVRAPGEFLMIRHLRIISPYLSNTEEDFLPEVASMGLTETDFRMNSPTGAKPEHIWVLVSAAGMDFFNPEERSSIYERKDGEKTRVPRSRYDRPEK